MRVVVGAAQVARVPPRHADSAEDIFQFLRSIDRVARYCAQIDGFCAFLPFAGGVRRLEGAVKKLRADARRNYFAGSRLEIDTNRAVPRIIPRARFPGWGGGAYAPGHCKTRLYDGRPRCRSSTRCRSFQDTETEPFSIAPLLARLVARRAAARPENWKWP